MEKGLGRKHLAQALRQKKYTQKNPEMAKLSQTRKRVNLRNYFEASCLDILKTGKRRSVALIFEIWGAFKWGRHMF